MAITLAVTDNGDGTGGVATIAGATGGATVTLYKALFNGSEGSTPWASAGTRSGSGTIAVTSGLGFYHWMAFSSESGGIFSSLYKRRLTSSGGADSDSYDEFHNSVWDAVINRIAAIGIPEIPTERIYKRWIPKPLDVDDTPAIYVCPLGYEEYSDIVLNQDDVGYPILVAIVEKAGSDYASSPRKRLSWRHRIRKALTNQPLAGVDVYNAKFIPDGILDPEVYLAKNWWLSVMAWNFFHREERGLT